MGPTLVEKAAETLQQSQNSTTSGCCSYMLFFVDPFFSELSKPLLFYEPNPEAVKQTLSVGVLKFDRQIGRTE